MKSAILVISYNRPQEFSRLNKILKKEKNRKIFIFQDGQKGKDNNWLKQNQLLKKIIKNKNINIKFSPKNYGCKLGVKKAIDWFFYNNKEGIILEDDCLPSKSFFKYCDKLLKIYRKKNKVKIISGYNFYKNTKIKESYFFTKHVEVWGWASWRRVWNKFSFNTRDWENRGKKVLIERFKNNNNLNEYYLKKFDLTFKNKIDTWDHQFVYYIWRSKGLTICPSMNLVQNIGFNLNATHTKNKHSKLELKSNNLKYPLNHPKEIKENVDMTDKMDKYLEKEIYYLKKHNNTFKDSVLKIYKKIKI